MHIERTGAVEPLTPEIQRFIQGALGGVSLDTPETSSQLRPDWSCLRGLIALELKSLEGDPEERIENLSEKFRQREDWPVFYGKMPLDKILTLTSDPERLNLEALDRMGRPIRTHLKKADEQLLAHEKRVMRKNLVRVVWLVNEDHAIYDPESTAFIMAKTLRREGPQNGPLAGIDAVLFKTQRHAQPIKDRIAFPIVIMFGPGSDDAEWKRLVVQEIARRWAQWQGLPYFHQEPKLGRFSTIEAIPQKMKRHELWRLEYRRNPYLRGLAVPRLCDRFDEVIVLQLLASHRNSPSKPANGVQLMERFTHILEESSHRGIAIDVFAAKQGRHIAAARRLNLPPHVIAWLRGVWNMQAA